MRGEMCEGSPSWGGRMGHTRSYSLGILSSRVRRPLLLDRMRWTCCGGLSWMVRSTERRLSRTCRRLSGSSWMVMG